MILQLTFISKQLTDLPTFVSCFSCAVLKGWQPICTTVKSVILSSPFLKTLNTATIAGMPLLCRLATESCCCCWKLIAQWIICQSYTMLHLVFFTLTLFISLSFLLCCPHACCSPSLHLTLFISHSVHALVSTLCFGATADCSGGLQYTQGVYWGVKMCVCPHAHTYTHIQRWGFRLILFCLWFNLFGWRQHSLCKALWFTKKKQKIQCAFVCLCYRVSYRLTHIHLDQHDVTPIHL